MPTIAVNRAFRRATGGVFRTRDNFGTLLKEIIFDVTFKATDNYDRTTTGVGAKLDFSKWFNQLITVENIHDDITEYAYISKIFLTAKANEPALLDYEAKLEIIDLATTPEEASDTNAETVLGNTKMRVRVTGY